LARRTWSQNVMTSELEIHLSWYQAYYHFCRGHQSLKTEYTVTNKAGALVQRYRKRTPAMAAGWTRHHWSVAEMILYPLPVLATTHIRSLLEDVASDSEISLLGSSDSI